jgi:hypothetical protein
MSQKPSDFKASGIRAERIIASGSSSNPRLLLIGSGAAGNDGVNVDTSNLVLAGTGSDTWLFISGSAGGNDRVTFGGDVYISGTLFGVSSTTPGLPTNSIQYNNAGAFAGSSNFKFISNNLLLTGSLQTKGSLLLSGTAGVTGSLTIKDDVAGTPQLTLSSSAGRVDHSYYSDGNYYVTNAKSGGELWLSVTAPGGIGANVLRVYPRNGGQTLTMFGSGVLASSTATNPVNAQDTNFYVEGVAGSRGTTTRGTSVFGGDLTVSGALSARQGISGSLTKLTDGTSYLIAGSNITITTGSTGAITIASTGGGGTPGGSNTYVQFNDGGSTFGGDSGLTYDKTLDILTGVTIKATTGLSGSLTKLTDGTSYLIAGSNVTITTGTNGAVTIASTGGGTAAGSDTYVQFNDGGSAFGGDSGLTYNKTADVLTGVTIKATNGFSGSLTKLTDGTAYLVASSSSTMAQTGSVSVTTASNGQVTVNSYVFPSDLTVSLTGGRTFGRYATGATIPATGKTPAEVILLAIAEPITPTVSLTATNPISSTFGISGSVTTSITGSYTINTLGATISTADLIFKSGSQANWVSLTTSTTTPLRYDHTLTLPSFFTDTLNYRYIITDSAGAIATGSATVTPQAYASPSISLTTATTSTGGFSNETNTLRERGNVGSTISGTITRNRANAPISSYSVQYQVNGAGSWFDVPGLGSVPVTGNPSSISIPSTSHNDSALNTSTSLLYRVTIVDSYQATTGSSSTITFQYGMFYGPSASAPVNSANVRALGTKTLVSAGGTTILDTGNTQVNFTMALPTTVAASDTISSVTDLDALNADITSSYVLSTFNVNDGGGTAVSYKVYTMTIASPYASSHRHSIVRA